MCLVFRICWIYRCHSLDIYIQRAGSIDAADWIYRSRKQMMYLPQTPTIKGMQKIEVAEG